MDSELILSSSIFLDDVRSSWAVDDVFIGATNMLSNGFYDDFESFESETENLNNENWYKLKGGQVVVALDECSWDGQKKIKGQSVILGSNGEMIKTHVRISN